MIQLAALIRETFQEAISNRVLLGFLLISGLALLIIAVVLNFSGAAETIERLQPGPEFPDDAALREFSREWLSRIALIFYSATVLIATFITAGFVPNLMQQGIIDLYLSKPISRTTLLLGKVLGGLAVVLCCILFFVLVSWLIVATATGIWNTDYLLSGIPILLSFLGMYAILVFVGVSSGSTALAMIVVYVLAIIVSPLLYGRAALLAEYFNTPFWNAVFDALYYAVPQVQDCSQMAMNIIQEKRVESLVPLYQSTLVAIVFFLLSVASFRRKEF